MTRNRFEEKVARRRRTASIFSIAYFFLLAAAEMVIDFLVFWVALPGLTGDQRWVIVGMFAVITVLAYMAGWSAQRNFKGTVDTWLAEADEVEKLVLSAAIQNDHAKLLELENTVDVTGTAK
jgi:membrane protein implicated in regulation of membrane protease activity